MNPPPWFDESATGQAEAIYLHVPFCRSRCRYCDFYSTAPARPGRMDAYCRALPKELQACRGALARPVRSVFFGGGTPTVLGERRLIWLLGLLAERLDGQTEVTVEANPCTVSPGLARGLLAAGVNRVSLGVQTLQEAELACLGRAHSPADVRAAVGALRGAGLKNLSLDLIYGIPGQTQESFQRTLEAVLELGPEHVSCYALSIEEGTLLEGDLRAGRLVEPDEQAVRSMYEQAVAFWVNRAGMEQYELSNFALPGRACGQNLTYWRNEAYLGLGPGAASFLGGTRRNNAPDLDAWCAALDAGEQPPGTAERLTGPEAWAEALMLGLRMSEGVNVEAFAERYGRGPGQAFPATMRKHLAWGSLEIVAGRLRLTPQARFVSNSVLADFIAEAGQNAETVKK